MTALDHLVSLDVMSHAFAGRQSTKPVEGAHLGEAMLVVISLEEALEGDDALAVLQWQQEVVVDADVNWFELGAGDVQLLEWNLDVCEC